MTKVSDTQAIILSEAWQHSDGLATPPESLPPAPRGTVTKRLLEARLVEITDSTDRQHPGLARKLDGEAAFLRITEAGLRANGVGAQEGAQEAVLAAFDAAGARAGTPPRPRRPTRTRLRRRTKALQAKMPRWQPRRYR